MTKPVSSCASRAVARRMSRLAGHGGEAGEVDPVRAGDEAEDRLERAVVGRGDEDERLDDLAELGVDGRGGLGGGVGRLVEDPDVEVDALARGGVADPLDPGVVGGLGHGRSLVHRDRTRRRHPGARARQGGHRRRTARRARRASIGAWKRSSSTGTARSSIRSVRSTARTRSSWSRSGCPFDVARYRRHYTPDWREMYRRLGVPGDRLDEANALWETTFGERRRRRSRRSPARWPRWSGCGMPAPSLGIVTAGHRDVVEPQLERTGLGALLPVRVFGDDLAVHKPRSRAAPPRPPAGRRRPPPGHLDLRRRRPDGHADGGRRRCPPGRHRVRPRRSGRAAGGRRRGRRPIGRGLGGRPPRAPIRFRDGARDEPGAARPDPRRRQRRPAAPISTPRGRAGPMASIS